MQKQITVSQILEDLENGMTRTPSDKRYNSEIGSIMEKYNLTKYEVTLLFKNEKLKGKKTKQPKELSFVLVDDTETTENVVEEPSPEIVVAVNSMTGQEVQEAEQYSSEIIEAGNSLAKKLNVGILEDSEIEEATEEENNDQLGW